MNYSASGLDPEKIVDVGAYERARMALMVRKRRAQHFNALIFNDPAWDVLLHLFVHEHEGKSMSVQALAELAGTGQSTMERWVTILVEERLVERHRHSLGGETALAITQIGRTAMVELLSI